MNRRIPLFIAVVVLVGVAGLVAGAPIETVAGQDDSVTGQDDSVTGQDDSVTGQDDSGAAGEQTERDEMNESSISPGERLSGAIGVQNAEVTGEVESRAFGVALGRAETDEERADIVAERIERSEERLAVIEQRQQELKERHDAGELSQGAYAARIAETAAQTESVKRDANRSAAVAHEIPETIRAERGLDDERLETLRERASELSGGEVAAVARGVAGNNVGGSMASERRGGVGGTPANESDRPGNAGYSSNAGVGSADRPENATGETGGSSSDGTSATGRSDESGGDDTNSTGVTDRDADANAPGTDNDANAPGTDNDTNAPDTDNDANAPGMDNGANVLERDNTADGADNAANNTDQNSGDISNIDRPGYEQSIGTVGEFATDRATAGWLILTSSVETADERLQRGVSELRGNVAGSVQ